MTDPTDRSPLTLPVIRVFISSPSDVEEERGIVEDVVKNELAYRGRVPDNVTLQPVRFDNPNRRIPLVYGMRMQEAVNKQMPHPSHCQIVVGILWKRMGTPLDQPLKEDGTQYLSGTEWEIEDAMREAPGVDLLLFRRTDGLPADETDIAEAENAQVPLVDAFVDRLKEPRPGFFQPVHEYSGAAEFRTLISQFLDNLIHARIERLYPSTRAEDAVGRYEGEPYVGLRAYEPEQAAIFCGRNAEIDVVTGRVMSPESPRNFVSVTGVSGSGKSSLVKAGVVPRLAASGWPWAIVRLNRADPLESIAERFLDLSDRVEPDEPPELADEWRRAPETVAEAVDAILDGRPAKAQLLLVVDQFEELLTKARPNMRDEEVVRFLDALGAVPRARIVVTIRWEAAADLSRDKRLADWLSGETYFLAPPDLVALREMITLPAERAGLSVEPGLARSLAEEADRQPGALPLLSFALQTLARERRDSAVLNSEQSGEVLLRQALAEHCKTIEERLEPTRRSALNRLFRRLVHPEQGGLKIAKAQASLAEMDEEERSLAELLSSQRNRLLTLSKGGDRGDEQPILELAHESLIDTWPALQTWLKAAREHLVTGAEISRARERWEDEGRSERFLLPFWLVDRGLAALEALPDLFERKEDKDYLERSRMAREDYWRRESRSLAERARAENERGDHVTAALLALEALPLPDRDPKRPIEAAAFNELHEAWLYQRERVILAGHEDVVMSVAFSPDGARLATGSLDQTARIWDAATGREIARIRVHGNSVVSIAFSPDGARLATGSRYATARIWDAATRCEITRFDEHERGEVTSVAFSPDGARLATGDIRGTARIWEAATGREIDRIDGHEGFVTSVAFSLDGARLATGSRDTTARIWDAATGCEIAHLDGHKRPVTSVAFSPDDARLATASEDGTARIWDAATGCEIARLDGHERRVTSVAFSPDGARLATGSWDQTTRIWDAATGREIARLDGHEAAVDSVAFAPDGARLATGSGDKTARVWDAATLPHQIARLEGQESPVFSVAFSPDGARLATGSDAARIWDAATGREIAIIDGHESTVFSVAFSPDGARLATGLEDGTARVWDAASEREVARLVGHEHWVTSVAFSPDGTRLATVSEDGAARVWNGATGRVNSPA